MRIYKMKTTQQLPISVSEAWSFFSSAGNLSSITPPWMKFEVTGHLPENMYPGMLATYRLKPLLGVSLSWVTEITHMVENKYFIDEQRFGPYRFWHHQHHFKELEDGVEMTDIVHYALPYAMLGRLVHRINVEKKLNEIFRYRYKKLEEMFKQ